MIKRKGREGGRAYSVEPLDGVLGDVDGAEVSDQLVGEDGEDIVKFLDGVGHCWRYVGGGWS